MTTNNTENENEPGNYFVALFEGEWQVRKYTNDFPGSSYVKSFKRMVDATACAIVENAR